MNECFIYYFSYYIFIPGFKYMELTLKSKRFKPNSSYVIYYYK